MFYKYYVPKGVLKDEAKMTQLPDGKIPLIPNQHDITYINV